MDGGESSWEKEEWREFIVEGYGEWLEGKNISLVNPLSHGGRPFWPYTYENAKYSKSS
jgi:hypothetical protein